MTAIPPPSRALPRGIWRGGALVSGRRDVAEETPVAFSYNRATLAVMLATPADLADFALGFSLTEGIVAAADEIEETAIVPVEAGIELRLWLAPERAAAAETRRRHLAGPGGCGLCGIESLEAAARPPPRIAAEPRYAPEEIAAAVAALAPAQTLNAATRATHAAGFWTREDGLVAIREDVGRHNALDKLAGALARAGRAVDRGIVLLSSRLSVELVQKAAMIGAPVLAAVSAPTALAVRIAEQAGITLIGIARPDGFEIFTHPHRIAAPEAARHVA
ncbi:MAG: formate dehydrogenase accessory sulfurtransferase FdhD [Rhodospirillales bacterium]|nr:formate dehydrogenase accessory sulfurtransferase FdhD [Rhodospirillales bacterium]